MHLVVVSASDQHDAVPESTATHDMAVQIVNNCVASGHTTVPSTPVDIESHTKKPRLSGQVGYRSYIYITYVGIFG
jgi:hypothetical protein